MEIWCTVAQVRFLVKPPEVSFLCVSEKAKQNRQEKKASNIKEEKMQESKTKDCWVGQTSAMWSENCLEVK